jgi:hypothetical protein
MRVNSHYEHTHLTQPLTQYGTRIFSMISVTNARLLAEHVTIVTITSTHDHS